MPFHRLPSPGRRTLLFLILAAAFCRAAPAREPVMLDLRAVPLLVLSGDGLAPVLAHGGFEAGAGAELRIGRWIPGRLQLGYFHVFPSAVSPAGDLYRSFAGWELGLAAGARAVEGRDGLPFGLDMLAGFSLGADRYPGTTVAFASFSADFTVRADLSDPAGGWRITLPLSYVFRPGARSFAAGLGAEWVIPRRMGAAKGGPR